MIYTVYVVNAAREYAPQEFSTVAAADAYALIWMRLGFGVRIVGRVSA